MNSIDNGNVHSVGTGKVFEGNSKLEVTKETYKDRNINFRKYVKGLILGILKTLKVESEWTEKVKKDKELTKKQQDDAIRLMHGIGILWAEIFIAGCKHGDYTLQCMPDGSIIQRFIQVVK